MPRSRIRRFDRPRNWTAYRWEGYDSASRVDLSACALAVGGQLYFMDPISLAKPALEILTTKHRPAGIVVTNGNHARAAEEYRQRFQVPLCLSGAAAAESGLASETTIPDEGGPVFGGVFEAVPVPGGASGEMALYRPEDGGLLIVGDALINLPAFPFALLPNKYCSSPKLLRRSVAALLERPFSRMLFAHGEPLLSNAHDRLAALLGER